MLAGMAAGGINTVVGSGTLVTFPTLLALGYPAVAANVSNTLGLVAGGLSGSWGYRKEVSQSRDQLRRLAPMSLVGAVVGALLLIWLPASAFKAIVPILILIGILLVLTGPALQRRASARASAEPTAMEPAAAVSGNGPATSEHPSATRQVLLAVGVFGAGMYGGYFGAAQGVLLMGLLSALLSAPLQRLNGIKNVLGTVVNGVAAVTFLVVAIHQVRWEVAALIAVGSLIGGVIGAKVGRRLPPWALRGFIVLIGVIAIVQLLR